MKKTSLSELTRRRPRSRDAVRRDTTRLAYLLHHQPGFLLTRDQQEEVTRICDRLTGDLDRLYGLHDTTEAAPAPGDGQLSA